MIIIIKTLLETMDVQLNSDKKKITLVTF